MYVGRKKVWDERILLPLKTETLVRVDGALKEGEARLDLIRDAIDKELKRRKREVSFRNSAQALD